MYICIYCTWIYLFTRRWPTRLSLVQVEDCGGGRGADPLAARRGAAKADHRDAKEHARPARGAPYIEGVYIDVYVYRFRYRYVCKYIYPSIFIVEEQPKQIIVTRKNMLEVQR